MAAINGYLDLGIALSGTTVITPPASANYAAQPVSVDVVTGGVLLSNINCVFGPVSGGWGTLTCFGITDGSGNALTAPGTLQQPFTPLNGQLVVVPPGDIMLVVGSQFAAGPGAFVERAGPTTSGSVALTSGAYTAVVPSGNYGLLTVQNLALNDTVKLRVGDTVVPASGAVPTAVLSGLGVWPQPGLGFVPNGPVWAIAGTQPTGTTVSFLTG